MDQEILDILRSMQGQMQNMQGQMQDMRADLTTRMDRLETKVDGLENKVDRLELTIENEIKPNIKLLAEGHTQNAERLKQVMEKMDGIYLAANAAEMLTLQNRYELGQLKQKIDKPA